MELRATVWFESKWCYLPLTTSFFSATHSTKIAYAENHLNYIGDILNYLGDNLNYLGDNLNYRRDNFQDVPFKVSDSWQWHKQKHVWGIKIRKNI